MDRRTFVSAAALPLVPAVPAIAAASPLEFIEWAGEDNCTPENKERFMSWMRGMPNRPETIYPRDEMRGGRLARVWSAA